jgi:hypothetical protein
MGVTKPAANDYNEKWLIKLLDMQAPAGVFDYFENIRDGATNQQVLEFFRTCARKRSFPMTTLASKVMEKLGRPDGTLKVLTCLDVIALLPLVHKEKLVDMFPLLVNIVTCMPNFEHVPYRHIAKALSGLRDMGSDDEAARRFVLFARNALRRHPQPLPPSAIR